MLRRKIFDDNHAFIDRHNSRLASSRLRMNQFGALTVREFREQHLLPEGSWPPRQDIRGSATTKQWAPATSPHQGLLPASVDWRNHSAVSNVSNQGGCGACYAFAAVGAMEGAWAIHGPNKELTPLSVQNIVDCSAPEGNMGCRAGSMVMSYNYTKVNKGIDSAANYPYTGKAGACAFKAASVGATISDWEQVSGSTDGSAPVNISNVRTVPAMPLWFSLIMPRNSPCHRTVSELVLYPLLPACIVLCGATLSDCADFAAVDARRGDAGAGGSGYRRQLTVPPVLPWRLLLGQLHVHFGVRHMHGRLRAEANGLEPRGFDCGIRRRKARGRSMPGQSRHAQWALPVLDCQKFMGGDMGRERLLQALPLCRSNGP